MCVDCPLLRQRRNAFIYNSVLSSRRHGPSGRAALIQASVKMFFLYRCLVELIIYVAGFDYNYGTKQADFQMHLLIWFKRFKN